jgi:putative oxidoreductase
MHLDASVIRDRVKAWSRKSSFLPLALTRITLGGLFVSTGWGKVHHLDKVTGFFTELGIPAPAFNATLVGWSELVCGALLLLGLASRLASIPLLISMTVALLTAKRGEIHGLPDLFGQVEFTYVCMLVVVLVLGPGAASLDAVIARAVDRRAPTKPREARAGDPAIAR